MIGKLGFKAAVTVKDTVAKKVEDERKKRGERSPQQPSPKADENKSPQQKVGKNLGGNKEEERPEHYISDDEPDETSFV